MFLKTSRAALFAVTLVLALGGIQSASGQDGGGGGDGGGSVEAPVSSGGNSNNVTQGGDQSTVNTGDGRVDPSVDNVEIEFSENTRNQGFVGATTSNIVETETGFVGAASEQSGPALSEDASFGSGANDYSPVVPGLARPSTGGGGVAGGTEIYSSIVRKGIRAKLVPSFYAPKPSSVNVANRFRTRFAAQPGGRPATRGYSVTVKNQTAYLNGTVSSPVDSQKLERQLRLEPGVYKIVNRLSIRKPAVQ
ncbi:MAG: BON domain-containing protein [Mariniblastus sp.]|nr:BON domain-containing protein [Mariniblastus sp.]